MYLTMDHTHPYKIGLNKLDSCGFRIMMTINGFISYPYDGTYLYVVKIPNDARIRFEWYGIVMSNRIIIEKIMPLWDLYTIQYIIPSDTIDYYHAINDIAKGAYRYGHLDVIQYLVSIGADIHAHNNYALLCASQYGHLDVIQYLVSMGVDIHTNNDYILSCASVWGFLDVIKYLVSMGVDIHANDDMALRLASKTGHADVVQYIKTI